MSSIAPKFSVITPTFKRNELLLESLQSVLALRQISMEVIVGDDNPDGRAVEVVEKLGDERLVYWKMEPPTAGCPAKIRNESAKMARGSILYFLDDDDRANPDAVFKAFSALEKSDAGIFIGHPAPFGKDKNRVDSELKYFREALKFLDATPGKFRVSGQLLFSPTFLVSSTCLIKANTFRAIDGFDESLRLCEDVEFFLRAIRHQGYITEALEITQRRVSDDALSASASEEQTRRAYETIREKYKARFGGPEFYALKLAHKMRSIMGN